MKTISFFSEKGGVGKSSFAIMYASWLQKNGVKAGIADFNLRLKQYREMEIYERNKIIKNLEKEGKEVNVKPYNLEKAWPIATLRQSDRNEMEQKGVTHPCYQWFVDQIRYKELKDCDVVLLDFPGSLTGNEFVENWLTKSISYIVIPIERDAMTLDATRRIIKNFEKKEEKDPWYKNGYSIFLNKAQLGLKNIYSANVKLLKLLVESKYPILPDMISYTEKMATMDKVDNIRSTFGYTDFNAPEFKKASDLGIGNLFIDITRELQKRPDLPGTSKCDLSFVNDMKKVADGRQFKGSAFPEYEI